MSHAPQAENVYYFTHIPKAAGTSFIRILERQFPVGARYTVHPNPFKLQQSVEQYCRLPEEARRKIRCVMGHVPFGLHRWCPEGKTPVYLTILRQPVARTISQYLYIQGHPHIASWVGLEPPALQSMDRFLDAERELGMNNLQTRLVSGVGGVASIRPPYPPLPETALDRARENIETYYPVVGLLERFEDSLILLRRRFGWSRISSQRVNVTPRRAGPEAFSDDLIRRIEADNALDLSLYSWCAGRLESAIAAEGEAFLRERRRLRRQTTIRRLLRGLHPSGPRKLKELLLRLVR